MRGCGRRCWTGGSRGTGRRGSRTIRRTSPRCGPRTPPSTAGRTRSRSSAGTRSWHAWLEVADAPGETRFEYEVLGFGDGVGFVRGWTTYQTEPPGEFSNLWVIRLDRDGRAHEFTEWWMEKP